MTVQRNWEGSASQNIPIIPGAGTGKKAQELKANLSFRTLSSKRKMELERPSKKLSAYLPMFSFCIWEKHIPVIFCLFLWSQILIKNVTAPPEDLQSAQTRSQTFAFVNTDTLASLS